MGVGWVRVRGVGRRGGGRGGGGVGGGCGGGGGGGGGARSRGLSGGTWMVLLMRMLLLDGVWSESSRVRVCSRTHWEPPVDSHWKISTWTRGALRLRFLRLRLRLRLGSELGLGLGSEVRFRQR